MQKFQGTTRRAQKEALTNWPGPSHPFLRVGSKEKKISNSLTIANVLRRLKMNIFRDFRNLSWCSLDRSGQSRTLNATAKAPR
jgi:hypothetical protein